jgi:DNA-binding NarL/FixJ family response regulator
MSLDYNIPTTSVLFIDESKNERTYWSRQLKSCSQDYEFFDASDGESGLQLYRSRKIDCVVMELDLSDQSAFEVLGELVPLARRPNVAVVVLTQFSYRSLWALARNCGASACLYKPHTNGEDLDRAIQRATALVSDQKLKETVQRFLVAGGTRNWMEQSVATMPQGGVLG